jgi:hypothetical protein
MWMLRSYIIAPGVKVKFTIDMNYIADVDADVTVRVLQTRLE